MLWKNSNRNDGLQNVCITQMNLHKFWLACGLSALLICAQADARSKRSSHARTEFKHQHPCPANGKTTGPCPGYVIDHVTPLKRAGADASSNMQWQTIEEAKKKDRWE